ncbi:hypothetical protein D3C87_1399520 [compost metagenome]
MVIHKGYGDRAPGRIRVAVEPVPPFGERAVLHAFLEGKVEDRTVRAVRPVLECILPTGFMAPVTFRVLIGAFPHFTDAKLLVAKNLHPPINRFRCIAADEVEA